MVPAIVSSSNPRPGGCIRGAAFREFVLWYEHKVGPEAFGARMARMPEWMTKDLDIARPGLGLRDGVWYPDVTVHRLLDLLTDGLSSGQRHAIALQGSAHVMDTTLRGVFRVLFTWMATPERYASLGQRLWSSYYDCGEFTIVPTDDHNGAVATIRNWATHHPFICDINRGAAIAIYKAMKCSDVSCIRHTCVADGGNECRFVTRWGA